MKAGLNNETYVCFPVMGRKQDFTPKKDLRNQSSMTATYSKLLSKSVAQFPGPSAPSPPTVSFITHETKS